MHTLATLFWRAQAEGLCFMWHMECLLAGQRAKEMVMNKVNWSLHPTAFGGG